MYGAFLLNESNETLDNFETYLYFEYYVLIVKVNKSTCYFK